MFGHGMHGMHGVVCVCVCVCACVCVRAHAEPRVYVRQQQMVTSPMQKGGSNSDIQVSRSHALVCYRVCYRKTYKGCGSASETIFHTVAFIRGGAKANRGRQRGRGILDFVTVCC